jgi:hypothetical protein
MLFWIEIGPVFEDQNVSENFSAETDTHKIDPWTALLLLLLLLSSSSWSRVREPAPA